MVYIHDRCADLGGVSSECSDEFDETSRKMYISKF